MTIAQNTSPIYTYVSINDWAKVTTADTGTDGTGANVKLVHTVGSNGGYVTKLILQPISTSGSATTSAAAARFYINNGSSVGTAGNNLLFKELSLAAINVNTSATVSAFGYELPLAFQLAGGYCIYCGITAMAANTQWNILTISGGY